MRFGEVDQVGERFPFSATILQGADGYPRCDFGASGTTICLAFLYLDA